MTYGEQLFELAKGVEKVTICVEKKNDEGDYELFAHVKKGSMGGSASCIVNSKANEDTHFDLYAIGFSDLFAKLMNIHEKIEEMKKSKEAEQNDG